MRRYYSAGIIGLLFLILISCSDSTKINDNEAILRGTVYYLDKNSAPVPVSGALISVRDYFAQAQSNASGQYEIQLDLEDDGEQVSVVVAASKAGFESAETDLIVKKGKIAQVADLILTELSSDTTGITPGDSTTVSGDAAHIELYGSHSNNIYVRNSGLKESARIDFIVTDSEGRPVDSDHRVLVRFSILDGPGGGTYLFPDTMTTRAGLVYTVLNSGTIAGPVQLEAAVSFGGQTIRTTPIRIAVYGGLPSEERFSVALEKSNIAGLKHSGIIDQVTAYVGDKYSNPVAPGTIVYFSTDYGIIEGAAITDELGRASVRYVSARPHPPSPADSSYAHVTARTFSDTLLESAITAGTRLLLSDHTGPIVISPTSFTYNNSNTPVSFNYLASDIWGYPLVADSKIRITATDGDLYGDVDIDIQDTQQSGPGTTEFQFTWAPGDSLDAPQVYINIQITTPPDGNGFQSVSISGTKESGGL